jgi:transcriptional regulator with XRE-family HTH domain
MKINEKIKRIRELKGWTQEQIAEKLNMSISGYSNIERGGTNIQFTRLEQIAKILEMKLSELIDLEEKKSSNLSMGRK